MEKHQSEEKEISTSFLKRYQPIFWTLFVSLVAAGALSVRSPHGGWQDLMHNFMGVFLCIFALFKLFDLRGFQEGFRMYDVVAGRVSAYGYVYPFIELLLGGFYLSHFLPLFTYLLTILVMGVGTFGVIRALVRGLDTRCACMGSFLNVPLSTVTLAENVGMLVMAILMIVA